MLEAGVHFGHQTRRWNPKMQRYIFGSRNHIHIIDLQKSAKELRKALKFVTDVVAKGGTILFVGTKRQAQEAIRTEAMRCGSFYVATRWVGGTLTNFDIVRKSINRLMEMEKMQSEGIEKVLNKKEARKFMREYQALKNKYEGLKEMRQPPTALFIVDPTEEETATQEATRMKVSVIAICDTNSDPDLISYQIPGNDDALRSIKFFTSSVADAILEAKGKSSTGSDVVAAVAAAEDLVAQGVSVTADEPVADRVQPQAAVEAKAVES